MGIMLLLSDFVFGKTDLERENAPQKDGSRMCGICPENQRLFKAADAKTPPDSVV